MSVKMETSVIQMPRALTLMVVLHAPAEMELQEMASPVKVWTLSSFMNNPFCYSLYIMEGNKSVSLLAAQCSTNFQLVLGPVDSCLNWRVSQYLCNHTITHVFLHIWLPHALLSLVEIVKYTVYRAFQLKDTTEKTFSIWGPICTKVQTLGELRSRGTAQWWSGLLVCVYSWRGLLLVSSSWRVWLGLAIYSSII